MKRASWPSSPIAGMQVHVEAFAGPQVGRAHDVVPPADLESGSATCERDTVGLETCSTCFAGGAGVPPCGDSTRGALLQRTCQMVGKQEDDGAIQAEGQAVI